MRRATQDRTSGRRNATLLALTSALLVIVALVSPRPAAADATLLLQWGGDGTGDGQFSLANHLTVAPDGTVLVADDNNSRIQRFTNTGTFLAKWGTRGFADGQFAGASGVATDAAGNVYTTDYSNGRVQVFSAAGAFIRKWGVPGTGAGQFFSPRGIALDGAGNVYVVQYGGNRVQKFTAAGQLITEWGTQGSGDGQFSGPFGVAVDSAGNVYVADHGNNRIQKFSSTGAFLAKWGSGDSRIMVPSDVAIAPDGTVVVADGLNNRVQRFTATGAFVSQFEHIQPGNQIFRPTALTVDPSGDIYFIDNQGGPTTQHVFKVREAAAAPVLGSKVNVAVVSGKVFVSVPGRGAFASLSVPGVKGRTFVPLTAARQIPVGSLVDARRGTVRLTSAVNASGARQSGNFTSGVFQVLQSRRLHGLTDLNLAGGSSRGCARGAGRNAGAARLSRRVIRRLRGNARGRYRTRGRYSAGTLRGTIWDTIDRCDGTLTVVRRGVVVVRDFRKRRNITVRAGKSYLARAPG
jgi:DNA-binding beta-propeller fold protein YncE